MTRHLSAFAGVCPSAIDESEEHVSRLIRACGKIARMNAKKDNIRIESVKDAATGYAAVVLGIICFIVALVVIIAIVRIIVGAGLASNVAATAVTTGAAAGTV